MPNIDEYKKKGGWYEFPNGHKVQGEEAAEEYLANVDAAELFEDEDDDEDYATVANTPAPPEPEPEPEPESDAQVVRMTTGLGTYQEAGPSGKAYRFTAQHPILLVNKEDVEFFVNKAGFELATPAQVKDFYS